MTVIGPNVMSFCVNIRCAIELTQAKAKFDRESAG